MKKNYYRLIIFLVVVGAFLIRIVKLNSVPPSLNWDEASWGYNAYSILRTARDEYGKFLPLIFKAFGDYRSAIMVYLTVPSVAIFGLNEFAVRLPAAVFGAVSIYLAFLVVREIFSDFKDRDLVAILVSFILAISPWNYLYSHSAWENNILMSFLFLGIYFFLRAFKMPKQILLSAVFFGLCFYVYNSAKLLIPLVILGLVYFYRSRLAKQNTKYLVFSLAILSIMVLPVLKFIFFDGAGGRLKVMSLFSYSRPVQEAQQMAREAVTTTDSLIYKIFYSSPVYFTRGFLGRYLNHFSGRFLFFEGDWSNPRHSVPYAGVLNHLDLIFLILGIYFLITKKIKNQSLIWYFLLIAPLLAALSRDTVQATRSYLMVFPLSVITAFGMYFIYNIIKNKRFIIRFSIFVILSLAYLSSFVYFLDQYFIHAPLVSSAYWQYGYKQAAEFIKDKTADSTRIVFTQKYGQPYIFYLFYNQYEPREYQKQAFLLENPEGDVGRVEKIDNIDFREIYWPVDRQSKNTLFVGTPLELPLQDIDPNQAVVLKEIKFLNGEVAFRIVETI